MIASVRALVVFAIGLLTACNGDASPSDTDASVDGAASDGGSSGIAAPTEAALPNLLPCPDGWTETPGETVTCNPFPMAGPMDCADDEAHFPGAPGCAQLGPDCPVGDDFPADPGGVALYVLAGATGGDGTRASPFGTIAEAMSRASSGATVVVGRGTYDEAVTLGGNVTLLGTCVAETILRNSAAAAGVGVVNPDGVGSTVRNLTIGQSPGPGVWAESARGPRGVRLENVVIERVAIIGILVNAVSELDADGLVVRDVETGGRAGWGMSIEGRSRASLARTEIRGARIVGVFAQTGSEVRFADSVSRDNLGNGVDFGRGFIAEGGSTLELTRTASVRNEDSGITGSNPGSVVRLEDVVIRDTRSTRLGLFGQGLEVSRGGVLEARRLLVERVRHAGMNSLAGTVSVEDSVVRDVAANERDGVGGSGIALSQAAVGTLDRIVVERAQETGINLLTGSDLTATDLTVLDNPGRESDGLFGRGLSADGSSAQVTRTRFERNHDLGFAVGFGGSLLLEDAVVRDTASVSSTIEMYDGRWGRALSLFVDAEATVMRALFEDSQEIGVNAAVGSTLTMTEVTIRRTTPRGCADSTCADEAFGTGLGVYGSATVAVSRFAVEDSALCGVHIADDPGHDSFGPTMTLAEGAIERNAIGACISVDGFAIDALQTAVAFRDNGTPLQAIMLPVPGVDPPTL